MIDLGRKPEKPIESKMSHSINYPSFSESNIDLGLDEVDIGKAINAIMKKKVKKY